MNSYNWKHILFGTIVALLVLFSSTAHSLPAVAGTLPKDALSLDTRVVCVTGYSSTVRDVPISLKKKVYAKAGIKYGDRSKCIEGYEVDHIIPLSIGGSNDISNLQLQSYCGPRNAHDKDRDELKVLKQVCKDKTLSIEKAHQQMRDWK